VPCQGYNSQQQGLYLFIHSSSLYKIICSIVASPNPLDVPCIPPSRKQDLRHHGVGGVCVSAGRDYHGNYTQRGDCWSERPDF
jgi:hypothetical protein